MAPLDRGAQACAAAPADHGRRPVRSGSAASRRSSSAAGESSFARAAASSSASGRLSSRRQTCGDRRVRFDPASGCGGAADEQLDRRLVRQRLDRQLPLGAEMQRRARGRQHHRLTHQQVRDDRLDTRGRCSRLSKTNSTRLDPSQATTSSSGCNPTASATAARTASVSRKRRQRDEEHAVRELIRQLRRRLQRQPRLPRPARRRSTSPAAPLPTTRSRISAAPAPAPAAAKQPPAGSSDAATAAAETRPASPSTSSW